MVRAHPLSPATATLPQTSGLTGELDQPAPINSWRAVVQLTFALGSTPVRPIEMVPTLRFQHLDACAPEL